MLPFSLNWPFLIAPSIFSNVYFIYKYTPAAYYKKNFTVLLMFVFINLILSV